MLTGNFEMLKFNWTNHDDFVFAARPIFCTKLAMFVKAEELSTSKVGWFLSSDFGFPKLMKRSYFQQWFSCWSSIYIPFSITVGGGFQTYHTLTYELQVQNRSHLFGGSKNIYLVHPSWPQGAREARFNRQLGGLRMSSTVFQKNILLPPVFNFKCSNKIF